ncbi:MJ1255/VC2487 family glycosyltransferase [Vibrio sp. CAU 1672]|uniref:MJ1255/VC2487 family glycosyltransferase n=1 Tax=Vibrio sp. CAU 1672 TaxID=3032594 RepID=UPI0023D9F753|nr:MJ1255/VC2487 family glycosyltransferase [Vibrio sp. CAU 1672]MDF2153244.1 glycosyltransferase family protein [Vibrio sp. CAU 1672]
MRILYGVQGTGNGHIARARAMSEAFNTQDVQVDYLFSGRDPHKYFSMAAFGKYQTRRGFTFFTEKGAVNFAKTALNNNLIEFVQEVRDLDLSGYDLVLNDFEPISAWAARKQNKACIGISHQNAFRYPVPLKGANWFDKSVIAHFAPARYYLGLHWYHFDQPLLPPIVRTHALDNCTEAFVLVYLPFEAINDICELLFHFTQQNFVCYHPDVIEAEWVENVELRPLCYHSFQHHLHRCNGVIANGGFELPSEALSLGKKLLLKPLAGQFEQQSNVATLEALGLAGTMDHLDVSTVRHWLGQQQAESVKYPDVAQAIVDWIMQGSWGSADMLSRQLWEQVDFPSYATHIE